MVAFGYTLMTEQAGPRELVRYAAHAERAGFDFEVMSDHYFPWLDEQGHAPYAWSVLGAVTQVTSEVELMTYVTCPIIRYHPAVVAQKAATVQLLSEGRCRSAPERTSGGHVVGDGWPPVNIRHEMLDEALEIITRLWDGGYVSHHGTHYTVDSAKLWDLPQERPGLGVAVSGQQSVELANRHGAHMISTEPRADLVDGFAGATQFIRPTDVADNISCGPETGIHVDAIQTFVDAGYTHVALVQIGGESQPGFLDWAQEELLPALRDRAGE